MQQVQQDGGFAAAVRSRLIEPVRLAGLDLQSRVVMAPMTRDQAPDGLLTDRSIDYYGRRAAGGVGLIISEGTWIEHPAASSRNSIPRFYGADAEAIWARVLTAVHAAGGRMFPQLWHVGATRRRDGQGLSPEVAPIGPSGIAFDADSGTWRQTALEMTAADIAAVIRAFGDAAARAQRLGFDGIELHGAHGYLIDQFLWPVTNRRRDGYGGSLAQRLRFAVEIVRECRARTGPAFPISFRFSDWKTDDYQASLFDGPADLQLMVEALAGAGVDLFHCSTRRCYEPRFAGSPLSLAGWTRQLGGRPVICVGSIALTQAFDSKAELRDRSAHYTRSGLHELREMTDRGDYDLAAVGRMLIANPDLVALLRADTPAAMRPYTPAMRASLD